jgi:hypothetical protein
VGWVDLRSLLSTPSSQLPLPRLDRNYDDRGVNQKPRIPVHCGVVNYSNNILSSMEIGQQVKVFRLRDRVSQDIVSKLGKVGVVKEFKMTDGSGVGAVVQFDDKTSTWFFEDELKVVE